MYDRLIQNDNFDVAKFKDIDIDGDGDYHHLKSIADDPWMKEALANQTRERMLWRLEQV